MAPHETQRLWAFAQDALPAQERDEVARHLGGCASCAARLEAVRGAVGTLARSTQAPGPVVDWQRVDAGLPDELARRLRPTPGLALRAPLWGLALAGAAAVALLVVRPWQAPRTIETPALARVERSRGQVHLGGGVPAAGAEVREHAVLRTEEGDAVVALAEQTRVLVSGQSQLEVDQLSFAQVRLSLVAGRVTTQAAHLPERSFEISAGPVVVKVVGTSFSVARQGEAVEVSVADGRVRVSGPFGQRFAGSGEKLVVEGAVPSPAQALGGEEVQAFRTLGVTVPDAPAAVPVREAAPPPPQPTVPKPQPVRSTSSPRPPRPGPSRANPAASSSAPVQRAPGWPPTPTRKAADDEAYPEARPEDVRVTRHDDSTDSSPSAEQLFVRRAEDGLRNGACIQQVEGLREVAEHSEDERLRQKARILRARCFDDALLPDKARGEYERYLLDFPHGTYSREARDVIDG